MIIVTGATGQLGQRIVTGLLGRMPAEGIVASVRDPAKASALAAEGIKVRRGNFETPESLDSAFAGATQVLVISVDRLGKAARKMHRDAIEAAFDAGARRVLYTSHMGARADSPFIPACDHAAVEDFLAGTGKPFTSLRHGFYAESCMHLIGQGLGEGELRTPEDGPVSWTARADLAEADAMLLAAEGRLDGVTPPLTALEAVTMADLAEIASEVTGREVKHTVISDASWVAEKVAQNVPEPMAAMLLGVFRAARRGDLSSSDPTMGTLLGRRPQAMREFLRGRLAQA